MNEELLWETRDKDGRPISLSRDNWKHHLQRHPEIEGYVEEAKQTVEDPDFIVRLDNGAYSATRQAWAEGNSPDVTSPSSSGIIEVARSRKAVLPPTT